MCESKRRLTTKAKHNTGCTGYNSTCAHRAPHGGPTSEDRVQRTRSRLNGGRDPEQAKCEALDATRTPRHNSDKQELPKTMSEGGTYPFPSQV